MNPGGSSAFHAMSPQDHGLLNWLCAFIQQISFALSDTADKSACHTHLCQLQCMMDFESTPFLDHQPFDLLLQSLPGNPSCISAPVRLSHECTRKWDSTNWEWMIPSIAAQEILFAHKFLWQQLLLFVSHHFVHEQFLIFLESLTIWHSTVCTKCSVSQCDKGELSFPTSSEWLAATKQMEIAKMIIFCYPCHGLNSKATQRLWWVMMPRATNHVCCDHFVSFVWWVAFVTHCQSSCCDDCGVPSERRVAIPYTRVESLLKTSFTVSTLSERK